MVLLIDNYDSFSYNLVQLIGELTDGNIKVVRNDEITIDEIRKMNPESIILSPDRENRKMQVYARTL